MINAILEEIVGPLSCQAISVRAPAESAPNLISEESLVRSSRPPTRAA
jgi:hypothetical protein